ncbi:hypothetical protein Q4534_00880 [Cyclobacterium sp. 1_MG-2023]|uniref:hypothetical protein n=1 Tax=Cyclobacterium sp. 1_MG-2023 TaxID=3062681 RepID=UPI0026E40B29|nr:hypothetical protein [Cyclobacterium sp. 1_MG-2023]MDO6435932.1 hypothetical protein [Cyclobacterium sp. 1_MG-2023]
MKLSIVLVLLLFSTFSFGQEIIIPNGYELLAEMEGDLDKDQVCEKVLVFETSEPSEYGNIREIQVLKYSNGKWVVWRKSRQAILRSQEGGIMGDPFEEITIEKGILIISFSGGSSWKWAFKDKYRFQNNEFQLIGHSSIFGKNCEYWTTFDFNLSTGKIDYNKTYEDCDNNQNNHKKEAEVFYHKNLKINLSNRNLLETKIITPKHKHELYF